MRPTLRSIHLEQDIKAGKATDHFWTEQGNHGTKTTVHVRVTNTGTNLAEFSVWEDVKTYVDNWVWNLYQSEWKKKQGVVNGGSVVMVDPGETKEFDVVTNEVQGVKGFLGHVRGTYVST
ncbi:MAG: hypothetical protein LBP35_05375 [Candidatus Ancillula trichonymphae]|jgi:hypothetical protein|nr:hypothetical protein [Candidatus Ancillula trichonymphae]